MGIKLKVTHLLLISIIYTNSLATPAYAKFKCLGSLKRTLGFGPSPLRKVKDRYGKYRVFSKRPDRFATEKETLLKDIEYWSRMANRDIRLSHLRRAQVRSLIEEAIALDHHEALAHQLRPLFYRVQLAFYTFQRFNRVSKGISRVIRHIEAGNIQTAINSMKRMRGQENYYFEVYNHKDPVTAEIVPILKQEIYFLENRQIDELLILAKNFDKYSEAKRVLSKKRSPELKEKASQVLELLEGMAALENFHSISSSSAQPKKLPSLRKIQELFDKHPIVQIIHLRNEKKRERWTSLVSRLSPQQLHELGDLICTKIPWLNTPSIRGYIRFTIDNRDILSYYPNIDRLVNEGRNNTKEMWEYLLGQDARDRGMDNFLLTFARRVDVRETWRKLYHFGKERKRALKRKALLMTLNLHFSAEWIKQTRKLKT